MTWFHYDHYGTVLQAAALSRVLQNYGHQVDLVNYYPGGRILSIASWNANKRSAGSLIKERLIRNPVITTTVSGAAFSAFREQNLTLTEPCETLTDLEQLNGLYDAFVCGSDQIWLPMYYDPRFFLDFVRDPDRMIAYAPSILPTPGSDPMVIAQMKSLISRFTHLSVRDDLGRKYLEETFGRTAIEVADPVLLIEQDEWNGTLQLTRDDSSVPRERYMLVLFQNPSLAYQDAAAKLASRLLLAQMIIPIHELDLKQEWAVKDEAGPSQLISLLRNADYICTDSYHVTALAMVFQKEFCCFEQYTERNMLVLNERVHGLLEALGLQERLYSAEKAIEQYIRPIEYVPVNYKLEGLKNRSREFLKASLEKVAGHVSMSVAAPKHILQDYDLCSGCGACLPVCENGAITMGVSPEGFYRAWVIENLCVRCERCREVCPFDGVRSAQPLSRGRLLTYRDEEEDFRAGCAAGGAAARLAWLLKKNGSLVGGCAMDEQKGLARHILIHPGEDDGRLEALKGIKLMTSDMTGFYEELKGIIGGASALRAEKAKKAAEEEPREGESPVSEQAQEQPGKQTGNEQAQTGNEQAQTGEQPGSGQPEEVPLAIFGTPCQIAGARELLRGREDVTFIEITCPGVPSLLLRNKKFRSALSLRSGEDALLMALRSGLFYNEACYSCRWRKCSDADIRIGDSGMGDRPSGRADDLLVLTEKGQQLINELLLGGYWEGLHKQDIREHLTRLSPDNPPMPVFYRQAFDKLKDEKTSLNRILKDYVRPASLRLQKPGEGDIIRKLIG